MSTETSRPRLFVTGVYQDGTVMCEERPIAFDAAIQPTPLPMFSVVVVRFCIPSRDAEELLDALTKGHAEINIEGIPPRIEV